MEKRVSSIFWLSLYFLCNLTLTIYNKAVMQFIGFKFPWAITAIHTFFSALGCFICVYWLGMFRPSHLSMKENIVMALFSVLYTVNIATSNISLQLVTVPFHQVVRATTPVFAILLSVLFLKKRYSLQIYLSLLPVIMGVGLATMGEYNFSQTGLILTLLGTFLAAMKTVVTNVVQVGSLKLHPIDLLLRMSPLAFVQCLIFGHLSGENQRLAEFIFGNPAVDAPSLFTPTVFWALFFNGVIAFMLNFVSFTANKMTSALTMTVAANIKQVLSILLAVSIFDLTITSLNGLGILITLVGGAWYTFVEFQSKQKSLLQQSQIKKLSKSDDQLDHLNTKLSQDSTKLMMKEVMVEP
ncbi:hypothetical protein MP228_005413 [Amoeboaphelidium protococcarum]|nr:hypothetical protein MP228_005413 [Amoeboaphelidium protococcarum]